MNRLDKLIEKYGPNINNDNKTYNKQELLNISLIHMNLSITDGLPVQIPGFSYLFIGSVGCACNINALTSAHITHIICLSSICKSSYPKQFKYLRINMNDDMNENLFIISTTVCNYIESVNKNEDKVFIHCYQGKSRSAAVICAYLICKHNFTLHKALSSIQSVRSVALPNQNFMNQLIELEKKNHLIK